MVEGMSVVVNVMLDLMSMVKLCTLGVFALGLGLVTCIVNKQFELLEFVFDSIYVDLQYDEISLTFTAVSVRLSSYPMWMR